MIDEKTLYTRIDAYDRLINFFKNKISYLESKKVEFARENKKHFKKLYPKLNTYYLVNESWIDGKYMFDDVEGIIYFKPTDLRFYPHRDLLNWGENRPNVRGVFYDCNMKKISTYEDSIPINHLNEIKKETDPKKQQKKITKVYVMIDKNTGYYKIGRSIKPEVRERTLQSEKPTIEMIFNREAFVKDEKILHDKFSDKRIRGEWFDLSGTDLNYIKQYFS